MPRGKAMARTEPEVTVEKLGGLVRSPSSATDRGGPRRGGLPRSLILALLCSGYFLVLLDVTIVNVALPSIGRSLSVDIPTLQWVVNGYSLPLAALLLSAGTIGDLHGHRRMVLIGLLLFGAASLGIGLATSAPVLIGARAVQGVGAAVLLPGTLALIARLFPEPGEQARAIGIWIGVGSSALPAGPLLGGALIELSGWRAVFLINIPVVLLAVLAALRLPALGDHDQIAGRIDIRGTVLATVGLASLAFAVIEAGRGGEQPVVVGAGLVCLVSAVAFVRTERASTHPMLPPNLFRRPAFTVANLVSASMNFGNLGLLFLLTVFLQVEQHRGPLSAGAALLPLFVPLAALAPWAGRLTARHGSRPMMITGLLVTAAGAALLLGLSPDSSYLRLLPALVLWGTGQGLLTPSAVTAAVTAVPTEHSGLASGINNAARQTGGVIGIAVFGAVGGSAVTGGGPGPAGFVHALGLCGAIAAGLWCAAAVLTRFCIPAGRLRPA